jgi:erythrocyte band 7 integral membrane protein
MLQNAQKNPRWRAQTSRWKTGKNEVLILRLLIFFDLVDATFFADQPVTGNLHICGLILTFLSYILIFFTLPLSAFLCIKIVQEYERAVIFRLGRLLPGGARGPGLFLVNPCKFYTKNVLYVTF